MHDAMRRRQTTKEDQLSTMPHNGRIPAHGGGSTGTGSGIMEPHRHKQHHQLPRLSGAPPVMAPLSEASASGAGDGSSPSSSWVKRGCMMELARIAKIPQPASGLMCPRCRSTETKFCYYNNYSLSQPRHFCRTCRRYWTHGGALRDLSFPSSIRRRRGRNKSSNSNKHALSKLPCCASGGTGRASSPSSSGGRVQAAATATMPPLEQLLGSSAERHRPGASRLWFPGHSSQQDPVGYRYHYQYQLGNSIRLPCATSSVICRFSAGAAGGTEAASSFVGQMQAAISMAPAGSAALVTNTEPAVEMMAENPSLPEMMGTTLMTVSSLSGEFMVGLQGQGENDLFHFLGSGAGGSSWPACGGYGSAAGNGSGGEGGSCTAAPGNAWPDASGFTSSSSGRSTIL